MYTLRDHLNDCTEPAGVADILESYWIVSSACPLVRVEGIHRDS